MSLDAFDVLYRFQNINFFIAATYEAENEQKSLLHMLVNRQ